MNALAQTCARLHNLPAPPSWGPFGLSALLTSGETGDALMGHLRGQFGRLTREEIYLGVRVAVSVWVASDLELQADRDAAVKALEVVSLDLDSAQIELAWLRAQMAEMRGNGSWLKSPVSLELAHG
jgi:hypothetical protein